MSGFLGKEVERNRSFNSLEEEVFLNLQRTANLLLQALNRSLRPFDLTPAQYNVLRILRDVHPDSLPCGEVGNRLVSPVPDVTRLLDRMERLNLVDRCRDRQDRRVVKAKITAPGQQLLLKLDHTVNSCHTECLGNLARHQLGILIELLEQVRNNV